MIIRHVGIFASSAVRRLLGEITEPIDPILDDLFNSVILNVRGDGTMGSTVFTDYSTRHANVYSGGSPRISNEQQLFGLNTVKFDGSSYLQVDILGGLGDASGSSFTVEFFFYPTSSSGYLFNSRTGGSGGDGFELRMDGQATTSGVYLLNSGWLNPNLNAWNFVQVICNQGVFKAYLNGVEAITGSTPSNVFNGTHFNLFGSPQGNAGFMTGYGANFRITRAARTDHSIPTAPFYGEAAPIIDDSVDLLWDKVAISGSFSGVPTDNIYVDRKLNIYEFNSVNQVMYTSAGGVGRRAIQFNGQNGMGIRVQTPVGHPAYDLGTKNWSMECWFCPTGQGQQSPGYILNLGGGYGYSHSVVGVWYTSGGQLGWAMSSKNVGSTPDIKTYTSVSNVPTNQWSHVEVTRENNSFYLFLNGALVDQTTSSASMLVTSIAGLGIGCGGYTDAGLYPKEVFNGYISDVRVTVGAIRHNTSFAVDPTKFLPVGDTTPDSGDGYRYYRINVTANNGDTYTALQEVILYNKDRTQVSSKFTPTFDNTHYGDNVAKYAFDGDLTNYSGSSWITNGTAVGSLGIDLVHRAEIGMVAMYQQAYSGGSTRAPKDFTLEGSNDMTTWNLIKSFTGSTDWTSGERREFEVVAVNNTVLLLHMDGSEGGTSFTDSSGYTDAIITSNTATISNSYKKFGTGSANFTYGGSLTISPGSKFNFSNKPFTIEFQMNSNGYGSGAIFSGRASSSYDAPIEFRLASSNRFDCYMSVPSSTGTGGWYGLSGFTTAQNMLQGIWYHVALVGTGTTLRLFVDGIEANNTLGYTAIADLYQPLNIGRGGDGQFNGFIDEFRITKAALYAANFTPPTAAFGDTTPVVVPDPITDQTILIMNMDGSVGSNTFTDSSAYSRTLVANSATLSSQGLVSGQSGDFTGSESKVTVGGLVDFDFGLGDLTIEGTFMITQNTSGYQIVYEHTYGGGKRIAIRFGDGGFGNRLQFCTLDSGFGTAFRPVSDPTKTSMLNTIQHFAMVRKDGRLLVFLNGVQQGLNSEQGEGVEPTKAWGDNISITTQVAIGGSATYSNCGLRGLMDEVRVTKGLARYTSDYTVATTPFQKYDATTFDVAKMPPYGATLSADKKTISMQSIYFGLTTTGKNTGKWYAELTNSLGGMYENKVVVAKFPRDDFSYVNSDEASLFFNSFGGIPSNAIVGVALDCDNHTVSFYINNVLVGTQTGMASDTLYIGAGQGFGTAKVATFTGHFQASEFTYTPPTGFLPWDNFESTPYMGADPYVSNVAMMLHGEGDTVVDSGSTGVSNYNGVVTTTAQYKVGSSSLGFLNGNAYLRFNNTAKTAFKDKDFTIEGWYRFNNGEDNVQQMMYFNYLSNFGSGCIFFGKHPTYQGKVSFWAGSQSMAGAILVDNTYPVSNTWIHYAINRTGNTMTMYRDGVQVATVSVSGNITNDSVDDGYIGAGENNGFQGYLDEFRITNGVGRYPFPFTPPVKPGTDPS